MSGKTVKLTLLKPNKENPRIIRDANWKRLLSTIEKYPHFLAKRPIIIDSWDNPVVIAGNMRFKALKALKHKEVPEEWIRAADDLTAEEKQAFIILDNTNAGEWDFDTLANDWDIPELESLGVFIPNLNDSPRQIDDDIEEDQGHNSRSSSKNTDETLNEVTLYFTDEELDLFKSNIYQHGSSMEEAVLNLINNSDAETSV